MKLRSSILILIGVLFFTQIGFGQTAESEFKPLHLINYTKLATPTDESIKQIGTEYELSGTAMTRNKKELFVTDGGADHYIYKLGRGPSTLGVWLNLYDIAGFEDYVKASEAKASKGRGLDLEGMAMCERNGLRTIFLVNERVRDIIKIKKPFNGVYSFEEISSQLKEHIADFSDRLSSVTHVEKGLFKADYSATPLFEKTKAGNPSAQYGNAGFEGIAADCDNEKIYIAKERQPAYIVKADFNGNVDSIFTLPTNPRMFATIEPNPITGKGTFTTEPDISDVYFYQGNLFVLERNAGSIAELNGQTGQLIARYDYKPYEFIYDEINPTTKLVMPFGMAETLQVKKIKGKYVFRIGFDNGNENGLNQKGFDLLSPLEKTKKPIQIGDKNAVIFTLSQ